MPTDCGNCDICLDPPETYDATEAARKVLSCVYRVGQSFGVKHVVDVLRGADNERIRKFNHERLTTYGIGKEFGSAEWLSIVRQLIHRGYLVQDIAAYSVLKLTPGALEPVTWRGNTGTGPAARGGEGQEEEKESRPGRRPQR